MHGKPTTGHMEKNDGGGKSYRLILPAMPVRVPVMKYSGACEFLYGRCWHRNTKIRKEGEERRDDEMKGGDLERKGHKERLQGPRRTDGPSSEGRYRDIRQITNHPGEKKPAAISRSTAHTVTGPSAAAAGILRTAYAKQYRDIKLYDRHQMGYPPRATTAKGPSLLSIRIPYPGYQEWTAATFWLFTRRRRRRSTNERQCISIPDIKSNPPRFALHFPEGRQRVETSPTMSPTEKVEWLVKLSD